MLNLIIAIVMLIPTGIAFFRNKTTDLCWWSMFVILNVSVGLSSVIIEKLNKVIELLSPVVN